MDTNPLKALKDFREAQNISQAELARLLGVSRSIAHRWETGERKVGPDSLASVSSKTGIPKKDLRPDLVEKLADEAQ